MSHHVKVGMISDQIIYIKGVEINVHDIATIVVNDSGEIIEVYKIHNKLTEGLEKEYIAGHKAFINKSD